MGNRMRAARRVERTGLPHIFYCDGRWRTEIRGTGVRGVATRYAIPAQRWVDLRNADEGVHAAIR